jgi:N-dimethylarginine dimethylaminohydrolase
MTILAKAETYNGHSMVGTLKRVLVCAPEAAGWNDAQRLRESASLGYPRPPVFSVAEAQHRSLCRILQECGAEISYLRPSPTLTLDAVYTHDASLATDFGLIAMRPGKANRVPEAAQHGEFCRSLGIPTFAEVQAPGKSEAGDMVWLNEHTLLIGQGYRTNPEGIQQMRDFLQPHGVQVLSAPLPYGSGPSTCLHLMSLFSVLDEKTLVVDLPWLAVETVELLCSRGYGFIEIDASERDTLAVNVLSLGKRRVVALEENRKTNQRLGDAGFEVHTFAGSEICINGGGGPTCLTRPLLRSDS